MVFYDLIKIIWQGREGLNCECPSARFIGRLTISSHLNDDKHKNVVDKRGFLTIAVLDGYSRSIPVQHVPVFTVEQQLARISEQESREEIRLSLHPFNFFKCSILEQGPIHCQVFKEGQFAN